MKRLLLILMTGLALIAQVGTAWAVQDGEGNEIQPLGTAGQFRVTDATQTDVFMNINEATGEVIFTSTEDDLTAVAEFNNDDGDFQVFHRAGTPESFVTGNRGDLCIDTTNGALYIKGDDGDATGWTSFGTASGDITDIGDVTSGAAFNGTQGNTLIFEGSTADTNEVTFLAADPAADFTITIPAITGLLVTTGDTGSVTSTMILNGTVAATDIADSTITGSDVADDTFDFVDLEDTLDLDANLTLNQTTNTWSQTFTGDTTTGFSYIASSLTSGTGVGIASTSPSLTGDLTKIELNRSNTGNTGNVLKVGFTGTTGTATAVNVTNAGTGLTARFNDDGTYTDTTSVVIDDSGNVGIGDTTPASALTVGSGDLFQVNSSGDIVRIDNVTYNWPSSQGGASTVLTNDGTGVLSWTAASTGDITDIGDVTSGAAFNGTQGNTLIFEGSTADTNEVTVLAADPAADFTITIPAVTGALVTTGDTGSVTGTMILNGTVAATDITDNTITGSDVTDDTFDFVDLEDALDLDAATSITGTAGRVLSVDRTLTDATAENAVTVSLTASDAGSSTTAQYGLSLTNAASTEGADALIFLNNADADDSVADAIRIQSAAGTILTGLDFDDTDIVSDIELQNDETIDNNVNGTIQLTAPTTALSGDLTVTGSDVDLGAAGVRLTGDGDGAITFLSLGDGSGGLENLTMNFDDTANQVDVTTSTGVTSVEFNSIDVIVPTEAYDATGWNADLAVPTKDAVRDQFEALIASSGDITVVGDVTSGAAFDGTSGNTLIFEGSTADTNEVTVLAADPAADFTITIPAVTGLLVTTGDTGSVTSTMILNGTVAATDIADGTITGSDVLDDTFDFVDFEDALDLDAALTVAQGTNTWGQTFTGTTGIGLTYTADSLTTGDAIDVTSASTGLTGDLTQIELTGANTGNTGNVLKVGYTGTTGTATAVNVTNAGTGLTARFNDDGTYTDSTSVVIDGSGSVGIGDTTPASALTVGSGDLFQVNSSGDIVRIDNVTYNWPSSQGGASTVLTNDGTGVLSWTAASTGDITDIGDVTSGAAFNGTQGNTLIFEGSTADTNEVTFLAADPGADFTITVPAITGLLVTTGDTGSVTSTMILNGTVAATDIADSTITGSDVADDTFDFVDLEDALDLDAALTVAQGTNTWGQTFTGTTGIGLTYTADSLTTGDAIDVTSASTGLTGDLTQIELTGANTGNTGNVLKVGYTGTTGTATAVNVTNAGTGLSFRVNDDGTYTDSTAVVVDASGSVGIGDTTPASALTVGSGDLFQVNSSGDIVRIDNVTYNWPSSQGGASTVLTNDGTGVLSWTAASTGDITDIGDVTSGAAFNGTQGNTLIFEGSTADTNEVTVLAADPAADFTITIPAVTGALVTTGDTGSVTSTMILNGTVAATDIADGTITGSDVTDDTFDFVDLEDALDLDAALTVAQAGNTWSQTFTGTTAIGLTYTADSLTTGDAIDVTSASTGLTGDLTQIELTGANTGNTGNVLKVGYTGTTGTATAVNVTNAGTGLSFRVNDDGTYTDTTPVVVNGSGNVGIGTSTPATALQVSGAITVTPTSAQSLSVGTSISPNSSYVRINGSGGAVDLTVDPQITAGTAGQMIVIVGQSETNTVKLDNGTGIRLSGAVSFTMGNQDTITLIFDGTNWVELSRVNNPSS